MKSIIFYSVVFVLLATSSVAQQDIFFSNYSSNYTFINGSSVGTQERSNVGLLYRHQWTGTNAPRTALLNYSGFIGEPVLSGSRYKSSIGAIRMPGSYKSGSGSRRGGRNMRAVKHGFHVNLMNDEAGAFNRLDLRAGYSAHLQLADNLFAGIGPTIGLSRHQLDLVNEDFEQQNDPKYLDIMSSGTQATYFDVHFGGTVYNEFFYLGLSVNDIGRIVLSDVALHESQAHLYLIGGGVIPLSQGWDVTANAMFASTPNAPWALDMNANVLYNKRHSFGFGYRKNTCYYLRMGVGILDNLILSYAFEIPTSEYLRVAGASHELSLVLNF